MKVEEYHIEQYCHEISLALIKEYQRSYLKAPKITFSKGRKYYKILSRRFNSGQQSVHCFVDMQGNIYKAESWNKPAKGIRGNIFNQKKPLLSAQYYKISV